MHERHKEKRYNRYLILAILFIFITVIMVHFFISFNLRTNPPSKAWGKEVLMGEGDVTTYPKILQSKDSYIIAYNDGDKIQIKKVDKIGKVLEEKSFKTESKVVSNINLLSNEGELYLNWLVNKEGINYMTELTLDDKFAEKDKKEAKEVLETLQVDENTYIVGYKDFIEVIDIKSRSKSKAPTPGAQMLAASKTKNGILVTYFFENEGFNYFYVKEGTVSPIRFAGNMPKVANQEYVTACIAADPTNGYILVEYEQKGESKGVKSLTFPLNGDQKEYKTKQFSVNSLKSLYSISSVQSGEEARFVLGAERSYGKKDAQSNILDFSIKDNKISNEMFVSRGNKSSFFPNITRDAAVFCDFVGTNVNDEDVYKVYFTSQSSEFKAVHNKIRNSEIKSVALDLLQNIVYSISYIFIYGIAWVLLAVIVIGIFYFFEYKFREKSKKIIFGVSYGIVTLVKLYTIYSISYVRYGSMLPTPFSFPLLGLAIAFGISIICYTYGYRKYVADFEEMPIKSFMAAVLIDTILTQLLFVPFII